VRAAIPEECFRISLPRALAHLAASVAIVGGLVALGTLIPLSWAWLPVWLLYAVATGTAATGLWVIAHECGHGAFARNAVLQDTVGFVLHSAMLVPYFSWQRSHGVHHARTNHLDEGETHVPGRAPATPAEAADPAGTADGPARRPARLGPNGAAAVTLVRNLLLGWPAYLLFGASSGPARAQANHFWPVAPFRSELFPARWHARVWASAAGVLAVLGLLVAWAVAAGSVVPVLALYVGPLLVVNAWLVTITWLQHTDVDIPHYAEPEWSWALGAFQTVDRPYLPVIDWLHHRIGTTHVAHHIDFRIPHYRARQATVALREAFPDWYLYDPTPVSLALWRVARDCHAVQETPEGWFFTD